MEEAMLPITEWLGKERQTLTPLLDAIAAQIHKDATAVKGILVEIRNLFVKNTSETPNEQFFTPTHELRISKCLQAPPLPSIDRMTSDATEAKRRRLVAEHAQASLAGRHEANAPPQLNVDLLGVDPNKLDESKLLQL